jgi:hypothetical protein
MIMKRLLMMTFVLFVAAVVVHMAVADEVVDVLISPDTIVLEDGVDEYLLTVHAAISYGAVDTTSLVLQGDGVETVLRGTKPDSRGELVANFYISGPGDDSLGPLVLTLEGVYGDPPMPFSGSDTIHVIDKDDGGPGEDERQNREGDRVGQQED